MTLCEARVGEKVIIDNVYGFGAQRHLLDLGILPGSVVEVVAAHPFRGPMLVRTGNTVIAIGRGLAQRLPVRSASGRGDGQPKK